MVRIVQFIERRRYNRHPALGQAQAVCTAAGTQRLARVALHDLSDGGLSGESSEPIDGRVTIHLPGAAPAAGGWSGRVVRCHRQAGRFEVAVAFDPSPTPAG